ncbi:hypothetical protein [Gordonibacter sp. 28C]|nr:hypothetical protein [Gordonibacter sp. 28C]
MHMGYWVKASGSGIEPAVALSTAAFSLASFALFAVAAYGGVLRGEGRRA